MVSEGKKLRISIAVNFWARLTRQLSYGKVDQAAFDSKLQTSNGTSNSPTLFLPKTSNGTENATEYNYYAHDKNLTIKFLPNVSSFTDDEYYTIAREPGILALDFGPDKKPMKYVVPGGRFNEFYGWDSYFVALGLITDGHNDLAADVASQFSYEIRNYGKILNANRPYYLGRTQPPFLTDLAWRLHDNASHEDFIYWIKTAILEYNSVWKSAPRYDECTGLSKYYAQGRGIPPETEPGHFDDVLKPYADKYHMDVKKFADEYNAKRVNEPSLDRYFLHDRSLRESGHDVTSRFVNCCADLVTIDLTSLLYKYEKDIATAIATYPDEFEGECVTKWRNLADKRKEAANKYLWDDSRGYFGDYNTRNGTLNTDNFLSATTLWPLWSGMASQGQAKSIVSKALPRLEFSGGLSSTAKLATNTSRQWDYPVGWAPHQILAWEGLEKYGFSEAAERLSLKWVNTIIKSANETNGTLYEKYDVTGVDKPYNVLAEYGNQGSSQTGFGWTNTAFGIGWDRYASNLQNVTL